MDQFSEADEFEQEITGFISPQPKGDKIAVIGPMDFPELDVIPRYVRSLPEVTTVVSGGWDARNENGDIYGVDSTAIHEPERLHLKREVYFLHWKVHVENAVAIRNDAIVSACDKVLAFWHRDSDSETADLVARAQIAGKPVRIRRSGLVPGEGITALNRSHS